MTEKGLREVVAAQTRISDIDGEQGRLWYVGYEISDLAGRGLVLPAGAGHGAHRDPRRVSPVGRPRALSGL